MRLATRTEGAMGFMMDPIHGLQVCCNLQQLAEQFSDQVVQSFDLVFSAF